MKKTILFLAIAILGAVTLGAQTGQGSTIIGGTAGFTSQKSGDIRYSTIDINPSLRYFIIDRLAVGGSLSMGAFIYDGNTNASFGIGPSARYYITATRPTAFFAQAGLSVSRFVYDSDFNEDRTATGIGLGVGGDFFLNDHVALEAVLGFDSEKSKDSDRQNAIGLRIGVVAFLWGGSDK